MGIKTQTEPCSLPEIRWAILSYFHYVQWKYKFEPAKFIMGSL